MQINKEINGCEVIISFKPKADNIKDTVLWLLLKCFKTRMGSYLNDGLSNSSLQGN